MTPAKQGLGARLVHSSLWMLVNSMVGRGLGIAAQLVLAGILSRDDFGVYALAIAASTFLTNLRGAGMYQWLIQGGKEQLSFRAGDAFWIGIAGNVTIGLLIALAAGPLSRVAGDERTIPVAFVIGCSFPLISLGGYLKCILAIDLQMRAVALIEVLSAATKAILMVVLALAGMGPLSFVLPLPFIYLLEGILGLLLVRERPWRRPSTLRTWPRRVVDNRWILSGTLATTLALQVDYVAIGIFADLETLGIYFFAYQLTFMSASIVTENVRRVLFPGLVALPLAARGRASLRAAHLAIILGSLPLLMIGVVISPLESLVWDGKWDAAVLPVQLLALALPLHLAAAITHASLQSLGRFRLWTSVMLLRGGIVAIVACAAGLWFRDDVAVIAALLATAFAVGAGLQILVHYMRVDISIREVCTRLLPAAGAAVSSMVGANLVTDLFVGADTDSPWWSALAAVCAFTLLWLIAIAMVDRAGARDAVAVVRASVGRRRT